MNRMQRTGRRGFTLVELLVTISIIALLITIAVPAMRGARRSAKNAAGAASIKSITEGLENFKADNPKQNRRTNGYPSSAYREDPATLGQQSMYGAHWLVRYMLGRDLNGYIPRRNVPETAEYMGGPVNGEELRWYGLDPANVTDRVDGLPLYVSTNNVKITPTNELRGQAPNVNNDIFRGWDFNDGNDPASTLPVFVDPFGFPILYYASSSFPRTISGANANLPDNAAACAANWVGNNVEESLTYIHADNEGFTGSIENGNFAGWRFKATAGHQIQQICPDNLDGLEANDTWASFIYNRDIAQQSNARTIRPVNPDTFILVSPGDDGLYGTEDDIKNFD